MLKLTWWSGLVVPHTQVCKALYRSHHLVAILDFTATQWGSTCWCLPTACSNSHGEVVLWSPTLKCVRHYVGHAVWQPSWICQQLNKAHNSLMLTHSILRLAWWSSLVVPHTQVCRALYRSHFWQPSWISWQLYKVFMNCKCFHGPHTF